MYTISVGDSRCNHVLVIDGFDLVDVKLSNARIKVFIEFVQQCDDLCKIKVNF